MGDVVIQAQALSALGLDPTKLDGVQKEGTQVLTH